MKSATLPALRVRPELREAAERALRPDESLSRFMEASLESYIAYRNSDDAFIARGLRSAAAARQSLDYRSTGSVLAKLKNRLAEARGVAAASLPVRRSARKRSSARK